MAPHNHKRVAVDYNQVGWSVLRSQVVTDDATVLTVTTQDFANRNSGTGNVVRIAPGMLDMLITFFGIATDQTSAFAWKLYGFREPYGPGQLIAYGTGNLGDVAVNKHPVTGESITAFYVDFLTVTAQPWGLSPVAVNDIGAASGEVATITFKPIGLSHILLELTDCNAGTADETDELESVYSGA